MFLTTVFPTGHAYGISGENSEEVLVHVGLDTVGLQGEGFDIAVETSQRIKAGDLLCTVNFDLIKENNLSIITPIVITNTSEFKDIIPTSNDTVDITDTLLTLVR